MSKLDEKVEVAIHLLLYVLKQLGGTGDFHKVFKIIYFADQRHLAKYGSSILEDKYIAMPNGPVPSMAYDILKSLRGEGLMATMKMQFEPYFRLHNHFTVEALQDPDLDNFSESEISVLNQSIEENRNLTFSKLSDKSHDTAWKQGSSFGEMDLLEIAKAGGASDATLNYIKNNFEIQEAEFE